MGSGPLIAASSVEQTQQGCIHADPQFERHSPSVISCLPILVTRFGKEQGCNQRMTRPFQGISEQKPPILATLRE